MLVSPLARAYRSVIGDLSLTALTMLLIVYVFVLAPLAELRIVNRHVLEIAFAAILLAGVGARRAVVVIEERMQQPLVLLDDEDPRACGDNARFRGARVHRDSQAAAAAPPLHREIPETAAARA